MKYPNITGYHPKDGDYLVLADYHSEGLNIQAQAKDVEKAMEAMIGACEPSNQIIVKVVQLGIQEK